MSIIKKKKNTKKNTTTRVLYDRRPPREKLTNIKDRNVPITGVENNNQLRQCILP